MDGVMLCHAGVVLCRHVRGSAGLLGAPNWQSLLVKNGWGVTYDPEALLKWAYCRPVAMGLHSMSLFILPDTQHLHASHALHM